MNLCIYHGGQCLDGFVSAWVVSQFFPEADFVGCNYGDAPPNVSGMDVVIVDFSWPRAVLLEMKKKAKSLVVLDHHKTAKAEIQGLDFCVFDMEKSGARLAWEFFGDGKTKSPWLVDYAEDGDLWRWALPFSREVKASLMSMPWTFEEFNKLGALKEVPDFIISNGMAIERFREQLIDAAVRNATEIQMSGRKVLCTNVSSSALISDVGHRLAIDRPFGVTWFQTGNKYVFSLRSTPAGDDVSEVAKEFGGGGHRNAAGFQFLGVPQWGQQQQTKDFDSSRSEATKAAIAVEDGPLRHDLTVENGVIHLTFSRPVKVVEFDRGTAMMMAKNLKAKSEGL